MVGQTLGHYKILDKLGAGGMGEVYLAEDTTLKRQVALKVLPPDLAASQERLERFQREAESLAALNHPNIVHVYSVEEDEGTHFITMELVEGEPLSHMIKIGGLPLEQIFEISIPLADALATAHEKGIIHRDLKPANIMVTDEGRVKVLDFGLAKLRQEAEAQFSSQLPTEPLTEEGRIIGTVPYMSPEQLEGKDLDSRTDVFSLGVMLYEMTTGERPFKGDTSVSLISSIVKDEPLPVDAIREGLPHHVGRIIRHCLEKKPSRRFQSALDVRNELEDLERERSTDSREERTRPGAVDGPSRQRQWWPLVAGALTVGVLALVAWLSTGPFFGRKPTEAGFVAVPEIRTLAVLPLSNLTGDPEQQWFSGGITSELISTLSQVPDLAVTSHTSVMAYEREPKSVREIARELGVDAVIDGSVMREGDLVRIKIQLVDTSTDRILWSHGYDRVLGEIFALYSEVARSVAREVAVTISPELSNRLAQVGGVNKGAYLSYLRGREQSAKWTGTGWEEAIRYYQEAIGLDPKFGRAHAALAEADSLLSVGFGVMPAHEAAGKARSAAMKALELDSSSAEAHSALAQVYMREWNWALSEKEFQRAIELNPSYVPARQFYTTLLLALMRVDEARAEVQKAAELSPNDASIKVLVAGTLLAAERYPEALAHLEGVLAEHPQFGFANYALSWVYLLSGRYDESIAEAERSLGLIGAESLSPKLVMACAYARSGRLSHARTILRALEVRRAEFEDVPVAYLAAVHHCMGNRQKALEWFEISLEKSEPILPNFVNEPFLKELRQEPRFQAVQRGMGLAVGSSS